MWTEFHISWRIGATRYEIDVENRDRRCRGVASVTLDDRTVKGTRIPIASDGAVHKVVVTLGDAAAEHDSGRMAGTIHA
jgi:cyclic beta-1,2-glucan synthetase